MGQGIWILHRFTEIINYVPKLTSVIASVSHFHPSLIFEGKAYKTLRYTPSLANKFKIMLRVTDSYKHSSLLRDGISYSCKMIYNTGPRDGIHKWSYDNLKIILKLSLH